MLVATGSHGAAGTWRAYKHVASVSQPRLDELLSHVEHNRLAQVAAGRVPAPPTNPGARAEIQCPRSTQRSGSTQQQTARARRPGNGCRKAAVSHQGATRGGCTVIDAVTRERITGAHQVDQPIAGVACIPSSAAAASWTTPIASQLIAVEASSLPGKTAAAATIVTPLIALTHTGPCSVKSCFDQCDICNLFAISMTGENDWGLKILVQI